MRISLTSASGKPIDVMFGDIFTKVYEWLRFKSGAPIAKALSDTAKSHVLSKYPGSKHWSPSKIVLSRDTGLNVGKIDVNIPGASRAYHDIDIKPVHRLHLTIPMHRAAFGKKATSFNDLFPVTKKNGNLFLARNNGGSLQMMYFLAKHVHLKRDNSLMPSDLTFGISAAKEVADSMIS